MWWKFWTWFRHEGTPQYITKAPRKSRSSSHRPMGIEADGPEDILGSISDLIEGQSPEITEYIKPTRIVESVEAVEETLSVEPPPAAPVEENLQKTSKPLELLEQFEQAKAKTGDPSRPAKPARDPASSKRDASHNDARQTLVADDILKALSERFKNFDHSKDDDDRDGPSPYQTIVPNDD